MCQLLLLFREAYPASNDDADESSSAAPSPAFPASSSNVSGLMPPRVMELPHPGAAAPEACWTDAQERGAEEEEEEEEVKGEVCNRESSDEVQYPATTHQQQGGAATISGSAADATINGSAADASGMPGTLSVMQQQYMQYKAQVVDACLLRDRLNTERLEADELVPAERKQQLRVRTLIAYCGCVP